MEMTMNEPSIRKPTKKAFHFPKGAAAIAATDDKEAGAPVEATVEVKAAPKAKAAAKEKAASKAKAAPKQKAAPKAKAAPKEQAVEASVAAAAADKPQRTKKEAAKKEPAKKEPAKKETAKKASPKKEVAKKEKVVRDSFTMPKSDYEKIAALKQKCLDAGVSVKKSEVLRAGLLLLEGATSKRLLAAISAVEAVKTGRPSKS
jgi:cell wall-associated NlpC family hydrolase